jgi:hypothetical protein
MTIMFSDDPDVDSDDYDASDADYLFGDADGDSDSDDAEESRAQRRRRAQVRARRVALARRRQAMGRSKLAQRQPSAAAKSAQRSAASAVRTLDLETKVQEDTFRNALAAQNKRISRSEYAAVAGAAVNQFIDSFETPENVYAKAILRFAPLALLAPQSKGRGVDAIIKDPRVIGAAAVLGLVFVGDRRNQGLKVRNVEVVGPEVVAASADKTAIPLKAKLLDHHGQPMPTEKVTWTVTSSPEGLATIDPGPPALQAIVRIAAERSGLVTVTATNGTIEETHFITVTM